MRRHQFQANARKIQAPALARPHAGRHIVMHDGRYEAVAQHTPCALKRANLSIFRLPLTTFIMLRPAH